MDRIIEPDSTQALFSTLFPKLVLASKSENRKALLEKGGSIVIQVSFDTEEKREGLSFDEKVKNIAKGKMEAYLDSNSFNPFLPAFSADTLVLFENRLIGKAKTRNDAKAALKSFSGKPQIVITASSVYIPGIGVKDIIDEAKVYFKQLSDYEIEEYLETGDWIEAAGSYRLQRNGWKIVDRIEGDWTTVVGLPLRKIIAYKSSL